MEKCQRASTFRLSPPSRRQQWHCRSPATSNHGALACQGTVLRYINGNPLCKPTFILGIHGGRHQLCSDLHPTAFLAILSSPLHFFLTWCFWAVPTLVPGPSLSRTGWQFHCQRGQKLCQEHGNIWNKRTADNHCCISSVNHLVLCQQLMALHHSNTLQYWY